jgi:hypothetical protein
MRLRCVGSRSGDQQDGAADGLDQRLKEIDHLRRLDGARIETEIKVPSPQPGCSRNRLPAEAVWQRWRLAARRPGAHSVRALAQSAFLGKRDDAALDTGFLMAGHTLRFQRTLSAS